MLEARFAPIEQWPGTPTPADARRRSTFRSGLQKTLQLLDRELRHLDARDILLQAYLRADQIRLDGWLRGGVRPHDPGVILSFTGKAGAISFPCDTYTTYEDNLRAIGLALTALRAVDRYGVTRNSEQYRGWAKLPPAPERMPVQDAFAFVALHGDWHAGGPWGPHTFRAACRRAATKLHPDNP